MMTATAPSVAAESALAYARRGWPVFPCHSAHNGRCSCGVATCDNIGKHPRTPKGRNDASVDLRAITNWWLRWPDANVGIATGSLPGGGFLFVLDVDPRHGGDETLGALERQHGPLPETARVLTGGGGMHAYFVCDKDIQSSVARVGEGLDVRARGGYVLAPPSTHESGRPYTEDAGAPFETPLAVVPEWLRVLSDKPEHATSPAVTPSSLIEGNRNNAMASLAGTMRRRGFGTSAIFAALAVENREKCRPPLDELEVRRIASGMGRYAPEDTPTGADPWNIMTAAQIFAQLPPYPWLVEGLHLAPGRISLLNGYADVGKTVIAMTWALGVATGRPIWDVFRPARTGVVLHLNGEIGSYIARERYQRLTRGMDIEFQEMIDAGQLRLSNYPAARLDDKDFEPQLAAVCEGCALVIVDSLRAFSGAIDENSKEIGIALLMLARVSQATGATIVVLHHNRKPSKEDVGGAKMAISGSSSILGGSECAYVMTKDKGAPILVQHERSPIGRPMPDFGLVIEDIAREGDPRWGLRIVHMEAEQMATAAEAAKQSQELTEAGKVAEAIHTTISRFAGVFRGSRRALKDACDLKIRDQRFYAVLVDLIGHGMVAQGGTYHSPEFTLGPNR